MELHRLIKLSILNLVLIALVGVLMRYKIAFDFPILDQKNMQLAHSNFAFNGWVSLLLMTLMTLQLQDIISINQSKLLQKVLLIYALVAFIMFCSFAVSGYSIFSIVASAMSLLTGVLFCIFYFAYIKPIQFEAKNWNLAALVFNLLSVFAILYLSYLMASKKMDQHSYLASTYWFLHFQYNGWFFFGCIGLFISYLKTLGISPTKFNSVFWIFAISCIPAYGLSILWIKMPILVNVIIAMAAIAQFYAFIKFILLLKQDFFISKIENNRLLFFWSLAGISLLIKFSLQLGSTIPAVSHFAFGFRPIVIAYLHLVLLGFVSTFLITYLKSIHILHSNSITTKGIFIFFCGIIFNEFILALQGMGSINYTMIPYSNELLLLAAITMFTGILFLFLFGIRLHKR